MFLIKVIRETRKDNKEPFQQTTENYELGASYQVLKRGITNLFDEQMKQYPQMDATKLKAIVIGQSMLNVFIHENSDNETWSYFVMTENGKEYERL